VNSGLNTLAIDCGGTGLKATVLDEAGTMIGSRVRRKTPYPLPPDLLVRTLVELAGETEKRFDRASVGFPGLIRGGIVHATPHYVTERGPFSPRDPELVAAWSGYDIQGALQEAFGKPTRVLNDAEIHGMACTEGKGFEVMLTLGTGLGCALFDDGRLLPKIELSQAPFRKGETYDEQLGHHTRVRIGNRKWSLRVQQAIDGLRPVFWWDRLYVGGGGARHLRVDLGPDAALVSNDMGLMGGVRLWQR
jgi:polyphosphate glucokinase